MSNTILRSRDTFTNDRSAGVARARRWLEVAGACFAVVVLAMFAAATGLAMWAAWTLHSTETPARPCIELPAVPPHAGG